MGTTTQRVIAAALALGLSGCGGKGGVDTESLERAYQADLATLQAIACDRPVLRGTAQPGSGTDALRELMSPTDPELAACAKRWADVGDAREARNTCDPEKSASAYCLVNPLSPELTATLGTCGPVIAAAFQRAASHGASCSPEVVPDGKVMEASLALVQLGQLLALHAQAVAAEGRPADALRLLLDATLVQLDVARGKSTLIEAMVGVAGIQQAVRTAAVIARDPTLSPEELDALGAELDRVIAAVPSFHDTLLGDLVTVVQRGPRAYLRDPATHDPTYTFAKKADAEAFWQISSAASRRAKQLCPPGAASLACAKAMHAAQDDGSMSDPAKVGVAISMPAFADLARKHAVAVGQLHALRVELALGARTRRTKACPTPADASTPELAPLLEGERLGAPLTLVAGDADQLRIESAGALGGASRTEPFVLSRVGCKDGALTAP